MPTLNELREERLRKRMLERERRRADEDSQVQRAQEEEMKNHERAQELNQLRANNWEKRRAAKVLYYAQQRERKELDRLTSTQGTGSTDFRKPFDLLAAYNAFMSAPPRPRALPRVVPSEPTAVDVPPADTLSPLSPNTDATLSDTDNLSSHDVTPNCTDLDPPSKYASSSIKGGAKGKGKKAKKHGVKLDFNAPVAVCAVKDDACNQTATEDKREEPNPATPEGSPLVAHTKDRSYGGVIITTSLEFTLNTFAKDYTLSNLLQLKSILPWVSDVNVALILIKPHANTESIREFIRSKMIRTGFTVMKTGSLTGPEIAQRKIVERHYAAIASFATKRSASGIQLSEEKKTAFLMRFNERWDVALEKGKIINATRALEVLGGITGRQLEALWRKECARPNALLRISSNVLVCRFEEQDLYVVNGFYSALREKYCDPEASVHYMVVSWPESVCSWKHFRQNIIGETNPETATEGSLRRRFFTQWPTFGLQDKPTLQDNVLHASASPLEGLKERYVWCDAESFRNDIMGKRLKRFLENDPYGQRLLASGVAVSLMENWMENPFIKTDFFCGNLFDYLKATNATEFIQFCLRMGMR